VTAEIASTRAGCPLAGPGAVFDATVMENEMFLAAHYQPLGLRHDVYRVTAAARGLATDAAVATHVGVRRKANRGEIHRAAITGSSDFHVSPPLPLGPAASQTVPVFLTQVRRDLNG